MFNEHTKKKLRKKKNALTDEKRKGTDDKGEKIKFISRDVPNSHGR